MDNEFLSYFFFGILGSKGPDLFCLCACKRVTSMYSNVQSLG
jgi:hypothetical protein